MFPFLLVYTCFGENIFGENIFKTYLLKLVDQQKKVFFIRNPDYNFFNQEFSNYASFVLFSFAVDTKMICLFFILPVYFFLLPCKDLEALF